MDLYDFEEDNYEILKAAGLKAYNYMMEEFTEDDYCADIVDYTVEYFTEQLDIDTADKLYELITGNYNEYVFENYIV